jgi:phosphatidate cytidylyltransferase
VGLAMLVYAATVWAEEYSLAVLSVTSILYLSMALVQVRSRIDLREALNFQSTGLLGFVYAGVFPALATKTVQLDGGVIWLYGLFLIVFLGDTMAYLCGRAFGRTKLLPAVSPKKTVEGALGGLVGSALGGLVMGLALTPQIALGHLLPTALVAGLFGQIGDLFESLIKRLADEKDSGRLMPGHGGALDRVDGILFAAPIYYVLVRFFIG